MMKPDERLMAEFACLDPVYVDGIARMTNLGATFSTFYWRWRPTEHGCEKAPAMVVVRPWSGMLCMTCPMLLAVRRERAPMAYEAAMAH